MKNSLRIVFWIIFLFGGAAAGIYFDLKFFPDIFKNPYFHIVSFILGVLVLKIVMTISRNTGRTLAKYGREGDIPRLNTNKLVTQGVYAYMRHPMHLGLFLFPVSFALITGSLSFLIFIAPVEISLMLIMIKLIEEPEAIKKFGNDYLEYKKSTPGFCLKIKCLKALFRKV